MQVSAYTLVAILNNQQLMAAAWKALGGDKMHSTEYALCADDAERIGQELLAAHDAALQPAPGVLAEVFGAPDVAAVNADLTRGIAGLKQLCRAIDMGIPASISMDPQQ